MIRYKYKVDKTVCEDLYAVFDTVESRYIAENLEKEDADLIRDERCIS